MGGEAVKQWPFKGREHWRGLRLGQPACLEYSEALAFSTRVQEG